MPRLVLLILAGLGLFAAALYAVADRGFLLSDTYTLYATFENVAGLNEGARVSIGGYGIGRVEAIRVPPAPGEPFRLQLEIEEQARHLVRAGTSAAIRGESVIGQMMVVLEPGLGNQLPDESTIPGEATLDIMQMAGAASGTVARVDSLVIAMYALVEQIEQGEGSVGRLLQDDAPVDALVRTSRVAEQTLVQVASATDTLAAAALAVTGRLDRLLAELESGEGSAARLLRDTTLYVQLTEAGAAVERLSADAERLMEQAEPVIYWANVAA
ncbi:MAG: MlaD family protein, partial [Bacteroidota bacterium]